MDRHLLAGMTRFMASRGPDAQEIWIDGNAGFGHALLKTTDEAENERQPFTIDGRIWIVADARVDARGELIPKLLAQRPRKSLSASHRRGADPARLSGVGRRIASSTCSVILRLPSGMVPDKSFSAPAIIWG